MVAPRDTAAYHQFVTSANRSLLAFAGILLVAGLLAVACGDDDQAGAPVPVGETTNAGSGLGPGITIAEALVSKLDDPLLVNGWLWRQSNGEVRLCTTLTDATPPGCGKPSVVVTGLDLDSLPNLRSERGTTTSSQPAQLLGSVADGVLKVARNAKG